MKLLILILIVVLIIVGTIHWCEKKVKSGELTCGMDLWDISRRQFDTLINRRKFSILTSRVNTPHLFQFFAGKFNGIETCIFSIGTDRYSPITMGVLLTSVKLQFPNFIIRPKSFSHEVGDMLGMRQHCAAIPPALIDKYDVSSEDDNRFAAELTPEIVGLFLNNEGVAVEYLSGSLLITPSLISDEKNYEPAVQSAHSFAQLLGMDTAEQVGGT